MRSLRVLAAIVSGALLALVSPPYGLDWLHWFTFVPIFWALDPTPAPGPSRGRRIAALGIAFPIYALMALIFTTSSNVPLPLVLGVLGLLGFFVVRWPLPVGPNFLLGWLCGIAATFCLFFWLTDTITTFSNIPLPLAAGVLALFAVVFSMPYGALLQLVHPLRRRFGPGWIVLFPTLWVAGEWVQPALFPYYQGVGQYRNPYTWQLAAVFGATGLSWLVLATNSAVAEIVLSRREGRSPPWRWIGAIVVLFVANLGFGAWRHASVEATLAAAPTLRVSIVQEGVTMIERLQDRGSHVLARWTALTERIAVEKPRLVVWPEGSIGWNPTDERVQPKLAKITQEGDFYLFVGGGTSAPDPANARQRLHWNSGYLLSPAGEILGRYDKMVPLPFGEYLPWPFHVLDDLIQGPGHFRKGDTPTRFSADGVTFSTPICYEAILERQMRVLSDVDVFVNITNDGWFGDTAAPHQHAMLAAVHAVELGRPMLRTAYTGISMVVEPHGDIREETAPYTEAATVTDLRIASFETPYRTWGGLFPWACTVIGIGAAMLAWRRDVTPPPPSA